jgi:putative SOS response-associated peptidase YedK
MLPLARKSPTRNEGEALKAALRRLTKDEEAVSVVRAAIAGSCGLVGSWFRVHIFARMCGRFDNLIARDAYRGLFKAQRLPKSNFPLRYNIAPTDQIPIVRIDPRDGEREVVMARWGLIPFWMKEKPKVPHINARAETVHKLPLFREAFAKRRCLIPATGFYEWQKREDGKQPYRFRRKDLEPFAFAGIWEFAKLDGEEILSTALIVGEANSLVGGVHDRMPVMLMSEDYDSWLGPTSVEDLKALLKPYDPGLMEAYAVNRAVNSVKNDTEECIEPVAD